MKIGGWAHSLYIHFKIVISCSYNPQVKQNLHVFDLQVNYILSFVKWRNNNMFTKFLNGFGTSWFTKLSCQVSALPDIIF